MRVIFLPSITQHAWFVSWLLDIKIRLIEIHFELKLQRWCLVKSNYNLKHINYSRWQQINFHSKHALFILHTTCFVTFYCFSGIWFAWRSECVSVSTVSFELGKTFNLAAYGMTRTRIQHRISQRTMISVDCLVWIGKVIRNQHVDNYTLA